MMVRLLGVGIENEGVKDVYGAVSGGAMIIVRSSFH
jgi:hypothetical protein